MNVQLVARRAVAAHVRPGERRMAHAIAVTRIFIAGKVAVERGDLRRIDVRPIVPVGRPII